MLKKLNDIVKGLGGWSIETDLVRKIITQVRNVDYDMIIEMGSGRSTVIIAYILHKSHKTQTTQIAFEHLEKYAHETREMLDSVDLAKKSSAVYTPLKNYHAGDGREFLYYDYQSLLTSMSQTLNQKRNPHNRIFLLIDGPPGSTGPYARYPAIPIVCDHFQDVEIDVILDDFNRSEEQDIWKQWKMFYDDNKRNFKELDRGNIGHSWCMARISPVRESPHPYE